MEAEQTNLCKKNNCIPYIFTESGGTEKCDNYDTNTCFEPTRDDMNFYRSINWDLLSSIMESEMNKFMNHMNTLFKTDSYGFKTLVLSVYPEVIARINKN